MRVLTFGFGLAILASVAFAHQGEMNPPTPKEFKKVSFFSGKWSGIEKMSMGGPTMNAKTTMNGKYMLGGKYIQTTYVAAMGKMGNMEGIHLISFDPFKKHYTAFWFDSSAPGVMEMSGNFQGDKLIMISKPTEVPGMPAPMIMRATWTPKKSTLGFLLESKEGEKWTKVIEGNFKRG